MKDQTRAACARRLLAATSALGVMALSPILAQAQETPPDAAEQTPTEQAPAEQAQTIVVTGSRIARRDFSSDTPIVTVSSAALERTSDVSLDQSLSRLPQFGAGANQITSASDIQSTPTSSPGIATVNLRGLGSNRTLVLVNGRRTQPANASLVVDLNTIPSAAVDNVEIITGGAGATYGADAVAGVVNFILKSNFQGVQLDAQAGQTFRGDGEQIKLTALLGSNFADDRGNAMIGLTYQKRGEVYLRDRRFFEAAFTDPNTPGRNAWPNFGGVATALPGSATAEQRATYQAAFNSVFGARGYVPGDVAQGTQLFFNTAGSTADASLFSISPGVVSRSPAPGFEGGLYPDNKFLANGALTANSYPGFISSPLDRYSLFAAAHYDVSDNLTFYTQANFDQNETTTEVIGYSPAFNQWSVNIPFTASHAVPDELATILNARPNPAADWTLYKQMDYLGPRQITTKTHTYELLVGARGELGFRDWTYDVFASHGSTSQNANYRGFADLARYTDLIRRPNYGAGATFNNGSTGLLANCTSGLNPFVNTPVSQDCLDIISAPINTETTLIQDQVEANLQGSLAQIPAGDLRFAVGASYRFNKFEFRPDPGFSTTNTTSLTIGLFDVSPTSGKVKATEFFGEVLIPVLADLPFAKSVSLNLGARYSDYNTTGGVFTWKATGDWEINDWFKLRGGYQQANRAPNVAELFQPPVFQTVPWPDHDPCSILTRASYGNVASNPDRAQVQALCTALAGGNTIGDSYTGNVPTYFPLGRDLQAGNPNLGNEKASTWTLGAVFTSRADSPLFRNLRFSVDYYNITVNDAIATTTTQVVYQECFNSFGTNPTYDPNNEYCRRIIRDGTPGARQGFWISTSALFENLGKISTSGFDAQIDWSIEAPGIGGDRGAVFTNIVFNYLDKYEVQNSPSAPVFDYAGSIGSTIFNPPYGAQYRWKLNTTLGYDFGPGMLSLNWRHLPSAKHVAQVTNPGAQQERIRSYDIFDLAGNIRVNDTFQLRAGIDNLFDRSPNIVGAIPGVTAAVGEPEPAGTFDVLGRRFYIGIKADF